MPSTAAIPTTVPLPTATELLAARSLRCARPSKSAMSHPRTHCLELGEGRSYEQHPSRAIRRECAARARTAASPDSHASACGPLPAELQRLLSTLGELDERIAGEPSPGELRVRSLTPARRSAGQSARQLPALRGVPAPVQPAGPTTSRGGRAAPGRGGLPQGMLRARAPVATRLLTPLPPQHMQQLSTEKLALAASASELVRVQDPAARPLR